MTVPSHPARLLVANLGLLAMAAVWGGFFPVVERLLETWDALSVTLARQVVGSAILLALLTLIERRAPLRRGLPWGRIVLLGAVGITLGSLLTSLAILYSSGVSSAIVAATNPITAALLARVLYRTPLGRAIAVGTVLSVAGSLLSVLGGGRAEFRGGEALIVVANVTWTWFSVAAQRWLSGHSQLAITGLTTVAGAVCLLPLVALAGLGGVALHVDFGPEALLLLLYAGAMPIALGNFLWHFGVSRVGVVVASMYNNLIPVTAALATLWIGVAPTPWQLAGGGIIVLGVFYAQAAALRRARPDR